MKALSRFVRRDEALVAYKASADIVSKAVTLAVTVGAARVLSSTDFGVLALAMTTGWILSVASDAGLPLYLARRMAQGLGAGEHPSSAAVSDVMRLRVILGAIAAATGCLVAIVVAPPSGLLAFSVIVVAQLLNAVLETLAHAYRGLGRSDIESSVMLAQRSATAAAVLAVLVWRPTLLLVAVALAVPPGMALVVSLWIARRVLETGDAPRALARVEHGRLSLFSAEFARHIAPLGLGILLSAMYFRCDVYFVERWHGLETVGVYNAAFRIVEALRLFPAALMAVLFPALCNARDLRPLTRALAASVAGAAALTAAVYLSAPVALNVLYGPRFVDAAPALRMLALTLPLFFANYALTHQVIAWDGQRPYLAITTVALVTNLTGNAFLIPSGGMVGAAISTLVTELVVTAGCLVVLAGQLGQVGQVGRVGNYADSLPGDTP